MPAGNDAQVYAGLGEMDRAFEYWKQAYEQRAPGSVILKCKADLVPGSMQTHALLICCAASASRNDAAERIYRKESRQQARSLPGEVARDCAN